MLRLQLVHIIVKKGAHMKIDISLYMFFFLAWSYSSLSCRHAMVLNHTDIALQHSIVGRNAKAIEEADEEK